ncbi:MAG: DUF748 domain-containing protein, partial [Cyclobacteriaceae bacterium]
YLQGLFVDVIMYDSAFNFDDLIESDTTAVPEEEPPSDSEPMKFDFSNLELSSATFIIQDAEIQDSIEMDDINFFLPHIAWNQKEDREADLEFDFKNGGYFKSFADYNPENGDFKLDFTLGNYDISGYTEYVAKYVDAGKFEGVVDLDVSLDGNTGDPISTSVSSVFQLSDFALYDDKDSVMLGTDRLVLDVEEANMAERKVMIDSIYLLRPSVYYEAYDSTSNIAEYMKRVMPPEDSVQEEGEEVQYETVSETSGDQEELEAEPAVQDTTQQFSISINTIQLDSGNVRLADYNNERDFEYEISNIQVITDSLSTDADWVDLDMTMLLNDRGKMVGKVLVNISNPKEMVTDLTISSLMLEDFDVYCRLGTGYPLIYGDMYLSSYTEIDSDSIKSSNNIVIHNMKLGKRERVIGPPMKLAMFLLKDKDKVVHIDMPVEGPVGESGTDVAKLFWDQFSGLLGKVASTPFKFVGSVLNVFDTGIKRVKFDYMDSTLDNKAERQLNALLKLEERHEEVKIDLIYYKDSLLEKEEIAMYLVGEQFKGKKGISGLRNNNQFRKYVKEQIQIDSLSLEEACLRLAGRNKVDAISASLDSARFRSVRNYLHSQRENTDIKLYLSNELAPNNEDRDPRFEVKLGMKDDFIEEKYIDDDEPQTD